MDSRPTVIDLFCGGGGFSEGFRQADFNVIRAVDIEKRAVDTYNLNAPRDGIAIKADLLTDIEPDDLPSDVDVVVGSPPCKEFSTANNGGNGDTEKGMELVDRFLYFVHELDPEYWVMENVPRLDNHLAESRGTGEKEIPWLSGDESVEFENREVLHCDNYGTPQRRRRLFSGKFPDIEKVDADLPTIEQIRAEFPTPILGPRSSESVEDPIYDIELPPESLSDHFYNTHLTPRECKEIEVLKKDHSFYGPMSFPENPDDTARTVVAMNRTIARETLVLEENEAPSGTEIELTEFRKPTLRELATIQGFPITYQFTGTSIAQKRQRIGDAVPPTMAFRIALAIKADLEGTDVKEENPDVSQSPPPLDYDFSNPDTSPRQRRRLSMKRNFRHHVPYDDMRKFRVDIETTNGPPVHPLAHYLGEQITHPVKFDVVLYRGYAKSVENECITLERTLGFLQDFRNKYKQQNSTVDKFLADVNKTLSGEVPDATTLQAMRSRRVENQQPIEYRLLEMIASHKNSEKTGIVDRHFSRDDFSLDKTIETDILDGTNLPVRVLMKMVAAHFVAHKLNYCGEHIAGDSETILIPDELDIEKDEIPSQLPCTSAGPISDCISDSFEHMSEQSITIVDGAAERPEHAD